MLIKENSNIALISTKSIYEGKSREGGFDFLLRQKFKINFANPSILWPGVAKLYVCLFAINNSQKSTPVFLQNTKVESINQFFESGIVIDNPIDLSCNLKKVFEGSKLHGDGFFLTKQEADFMINEDNKNLEVIFSLIGQLIKHKNMQCLLRELKNWLDQKENIQNVKIIKINGGFMLKIDLVYTVQFQI